MSADNYAETREHNGLWYIREFKLSDDLTNEEQPFDSGYDPTEGKSFATRSEAEDYLENMYDNGYKTEY